MSGLIHRPWGSYEILASGDGYQVKRLIVNMGARISLQRHLKRAEIWVVAQGMAEVVCDADVNLLGSGMTAYIPSGTTHRLTNCLPTPLIVIETQLGEYLGEDDIERFDDDYKRV